VVREGIAFGSGKPTRYTSSSRDGRGAFEETIRRVERARTRKHRKTVRLLTQPF
jgi:hypothetical protein